jgi:Transposase IS66 family
MSAMTARSPVRRPQRCCIITAPTEKASIRENTSNRSAAFCRRTGIRFVDVYKSDKSPLANEALQRIAGLYEIEATIRGSTADARLAVRAEQSAPLFADLRGWMEKTLPRLSGKSDLAGAIRYALSRWDALSLVCATDASASTTTPPSAPCAPSRRPGHCASPLQVFGNIGS